MLYIYYMKINSFGWFLFLVSFFIPNLCDAQVTVVRVDGNTVYLDTSSLERTVKVGETFKLILSSEPLINPKTGKDLGLIYHYSPDGKITEVQPLYAVGTVPADTPVTLGQEVVLSNTAASTPVKNNPEATTVSSRAKTTYSPVEQTIVSISEGAVTEAAAHNLITLSEKGQLTVWTRSGETLQENASYQLATNKTPLKVSAVPVSQKATDDIFVTYYDSRTERIFTQILQYQDGTWTEISTIPYYVEEIGCSGNKTAWAQKPFIYEDQPGDARLLLYEKNHFVPSGEVRATQRSWLSGVSWFAVEKENEPNLLYISSNGKLNILLSKKKHAESKALFASTPNRVKYKQYILKFYPSFQVFGPTGNPTIAGVENVAKLGLLSKTFGQYQNGKIHFLSYEKGRLKVNDSVELDGVIYDTACTANSLLAVEVLPDGTSSVVEIFN